MDQTEKFQLLLKSSIVEMVNSILRESFGKGYKGNYIFEHYSFVDGPEGLEEIDRLCLIGKKGLILCKYVGQLGTNYGDESDGSGPN